MLDFLLTSDAIMALITLTFLEIILGIDNIVFISIAANKLPEKQRVKITNTCRSCADVGTVAADT